MDQDRSPAADETARDQQDASRAGVSPAGDQGSDGWDRHPGDAAGGDGTQAEPAAARQPKRPWWSIFRVPVTDGEAIAVPDTEDAGEHPAEAAPESVAGRDQRTCQPGTAGGQADDQGDRFPDQSDEQGSLAGTGRRNKRGLAERLRDFKEQLFPPANRPIDDGDSDRTGMVEECPVDEGGFEEAMAGCVADAPTTDTPPDGGTGSGAPGVVAADGQMDCEPQPQAPAAEGTVSGDADGGEPGAAAPLPRWWRRLAFWSKPVTGDGTAADQPASSAGPSESPTPESAPAERPAPEAPVTPTAAATAPGEPALPGTSGEPPAERAGVSPLHYAGEALIAFGGFFAGLFRSLRPGPRGPIDDVLAAKQVQREQLDREIRTHRRAVAALARKLRRGRWERKRLLADQSRSRGEVRRIDALLHARAADVEALERQGSALQSEIQLAAARHEALLKDIDSGHLQWESLTATVAQTKARLDTVTTELAIKRNDSASLDALMEERRREMDAAKSELASLEGIRDATEGALQDFRAQIARLDQDRIDREAQIRESAAEAGRIEAQLGPLRHQQDVLEGVLTQLQQDVQLRQELMQKLLEDGVRVKTEADQRLALRDQLASAIADLTAEKEQLQQDAARFRSETRSLEDARRAAADQAARAAAEAERLGTVCGDLARQSADLAAKQEASGLLGRKIEEMKSEGLALAKKLDELRGQKDLAEKALNSYRRELAAVDTSLAQKKSERERLDRTLQEVAQRAAQREQLIEAVEVAGRQLRSLDEQIAAKRSEHDQADQRLRQVRDSLARDEGALARQEETARVRRAELEDIAVRHAEFTRQLSTGQGEVARLAETGKALVDEIERNNAAKAALIAQVQELRKLVAATAPENEKLQQQRRELESWIKEAVPFQRQQQSEVEGLLARVKDLQRQQQALEEAIAAARQRQASLDDDLAHLDQEKAIRAQSIEDELARLGQRLADAQGEIGDAEREIQRRAEQRMAAVEAIRKLEEERDLLQQETLSLGQQAEKVRQLQARADELAATMAAGQKRLEEMFQENQRLAQEKAGLQQAIKQTEAERDAARERQRSFAEEVQQIQNNLESLRQTQDRMKDDLAGQETMLKSFAEENERSRQALAAQNADLQNELEEKQRKLDAAADMLRQTESEISSKTITREQLDEAIARLRQQQADALAQVAAATGGIEEQKKLVQQQLDSLITETEKARRSYAELEKTVGEKAAEETALLKRLKMLSTEAGQYQSMLKQWSELSRKIEEQKRVLEDLELQAEKKSGLFS